MEYMKIGERMKKRRKDLGISAVDLASKLSLSKATIHRYENGDIQNIKMPVVESLAKELKVNPLWLIGKSEMMELPKAKDLDCFDLVSLLDSFIEYVAKTEALAINGRKITEEQRRIISTGLKLTRGIIDKF